MIPVGEQGWEMLERIGAYAAGELEGEEAPEAVVGYAIRRAHISAFARSAEVFALALGRSYIDAFVYYLGLRRESYGGGT
jgi:hypothetical protein